MRIAIASNNGLKFVADLKEHWEKTGHEVKYEPGASEYLAQWADLYYLDTWDNNIHYLYKLYHGVEGVSRTPDWNNDKKPIIAVRALDWEVWLGLARDQEMINWVDKVICIAPHIEKELSRPVEFGNKLKCIRPGVNLEKFTLKKSITDGFQLGMVLGDMWKYKNHMGGLDIFTSLYQRDNRWRLHIRGQHENSTYDPINYDYYLESRKIKEAVTLYSQLDDMNEWYEKIDILLHPGQKEAFCYAVGEAMAKGIPTIINDFYGARDIWTDENMLYKTNEEAINWIITISEYKRAIGLYTGWFGVRRFIEEHYSLERYFKETDEYLGI